MAIEAHDADEQVGAGDPARRSTETGRAGRDAKQAVDSATDSTRDDDAPGHDAADPAASAGTAGHDGGPTDGRVLLSGLPGRLGIDRDRRASLALSVRRDNWFTTAIQATCFWMAISLPFLYIPLLITGIETRPEGLALLALLALNALSLLVGHSHRSR